MTADVTKEKFTFQAEISRLLHLLSKSLYQNREITIRELVSNASDAIDRRRHASLTDSGISADDLRITMTPDKEARILTIRDSGIGMTHEDLVRNLGTIAHSGSLEYLQQLGESSDESTDVSLIGQFGVGFYSSFMLAERVELRTRSVHDDSGWVWESLGDGSFTIEAVEEEIEQGTEIRLHLKEGMDEFTEPARLKYILRKYSTFVPHPVYLGDEHVNDQPPIWVEPKNSLSDEDYSGFFEYLTHPGQSAKWHLHLSADSPFQFYSILYCPETNLERMGFGRSEHGLHLCAKRILVQNDNRDLLPDYLRFLSGIVDSADLPLNVSREALQDNTVFAKMRRVITKKVLDHLGSLADDDSAKYAEFYREFGSVLREGIGEDFENRERLGNLLRFQSTDTTAEDGLVSLAGYCARASEHQKQIYFVTATDAATALRDPNLEIFRERNLEVLLLTDPADEYLLTTLGSFDGRDVTSVDSAELELPKAEAVDSENNQDGDEKNEDNKETRTGFNQVIKLFKDALGDSVEEIRRSERLTESACCLVNAQGSMSTTMQKVLQSNTPDFELSKMILEVNPDAPLVARLCEIVTNDDNAEFIRNCGRQLHANAMILSGLAPDGNQLAERTQDFMLNLASGRSSIVGV
ncbi:MAG: molecular chaperone HtpG [Fuerstiella sp.]|nr:molecular chaperone HtpG [Fuerstiella sp.]